MAEASIDIRVFPNKEITSVDFAEMMDAAIPNTGVIQGCEVTLENGVFNIGSGRLVVKGRLGVVTGGTIPNPTTLSQQETCWLLAVCDLNDETRPFYFLVATSDDLERLGLSTENEHPDFNITNGVEALTFGYCTVDPATGLASDWHALGQATARKGWDWYSQIVKQITDLDTAVNDKLTWKYAKSKDNKTEMTGKTANSWVLLPNDAMEAHVVVWVRRSFDLKVAVDFHIPVHDAMFVTDAALLTHANMWGSDSDGFVEIQTLKDSSGRWIRINRVFAGTTNITDTVTWLVLYR